MELRDYLTTLLRRWYIVVLVPLLVLAGLLYQARQTQPLYTATARLVITRLPQQRAPETPFFRYDEYYLYLSSEYLLDDLTEVVRGNVFARDVADTIAAEEGVEVPWQEVQGAIGSSREHRILTIDVRSPSPERATLIAQAATKTLQDRVTHYFGFGSERQALVEPVQEATGAASNSGRQQLLFVLQMLVAVFSGILLAFLIDYLDDTLHSPEMVSTAIDLPVIGLIPKGREG